MIDQPKDMKKVGRPKNAEGIIFITSRSVGYCALEGREEDIEIPPESLSVALDRDTVLIELLPKRRGEREQGRVKKIVKRNRSEFVGTITHAQNGRFIVIPDSRRLHVPFELQSSQGLKLGEKVLIELVKWDDSEKNPLGKILKVIGQKGDNNVEMESIILERGFRAEFPPEVEAEALQIKKTAEKEITEEVMRRKDMREVTTFTIDPYDAKDFDDALSFRKLSPNMYEIGVHIADVSYYVREKTALDREARKRGTSIYLVDRTIPMLPEILSNDLCSLNPNQDKLAFSAIFEMNKDGVISKRWFGRTIIRSHRRFTYEEAQETIDGKKNEYAAELTTLNNLAKTLLAERFQNGAISFEQDEVKFQLDEKGKPIRVFRKQRLDAHKLIEEFMLLANREVATYVAKLFKNEDPLFVYRIHDVPNREKIADLSIFLKAMGHEIELMDGSVSAKDLNALFQKIEGKAEEGIIKTAAVRSMAKAVYAIGNIGHFGLGFEYYTHFTSPIRRYPDVLVHRLLQRYLDGKKVPQQEFALYERLTKENTEAEIRAAEAERESIKLKQVEFMSERIGQTFEGTVSGVTDWGIYIEEKETKCEGMVKIRDIGNDFYTLDEKNYRLIGERTKKTFSLGDTVRFKVTGADPERKTLDYVLV